MISEGLKRWSLVPAETVASHSIDIRAARINNIDYVPTGKVVIRRGMTNPTRIMADQINWLGLFIISWISFIYVSRIILFTLEKTNIGFDDGLWWRQPPTLIDSTSHSVLYFFFYILCKSSVARLRNCCSFWCTSIYLLCNILQYIYCCLSMPADQSGYTIFAFLNVLCGNAPVCVVLKNVFDELWIVLSSPVTLKEIKDCWASLF